MGRDHHAKGKGVMRGRVRAFGHDQDCIVVFTLPRGGTGQMTSNRIRVFK